MGKGSLKRAVALLLVAGVPFLLIVGLGAYGYWAYGNQKKALIQEIKALPPFDEKKTVKDIALELDFPTPIDADSLVKEIKDDGLETHYSKEAKKIKKRIKRELKLAVKKKFPIKQVAKEHLKIVEKYDYAQPGDEVKFQIKDRHLTFVKGIFRKVVQEENSMRRIYLEVNKLPVEYTLNRILEDYYYLFSPTDSKVMIARKIKEYDNALNAQKKEFRQKLKNSLEQKYFKKQGFDFINQKWEHRLVTLKRKLADARKSFVANRQREIKKLIEKRKFLGVLEFDVSKDINSK